MGSVGHLLAEDGSLTAQQRERLVRRGGDVSVGVVEIDLVDDRRHRVPPRLPRPTCSGRSGAWQHRAHADRREPAGRPHEPGGRAPRLERVAHRHPGGGRPLRRGDRQPGADPHRSRVLAGDAVRHDDRLRHPGARDGDDAARRHLGAARHERGRCRVQQGAAPRAGRASAPACAWAPAWSPPTWCRQRQVPPTVCARRSS